MPKCLILLNGEFMKKIRLERFWGYCGKNASRKFVDIIAESLVVQRFCKYNIVTNFPVVIFFYGIGSLK